MRERLLRGGPAASGSLGGSPGPSSRVASDQERGRRVIADRGGSVPPPRAALPQRTTARPGPGGARPAAACGDSGGRGGLPRRRSPGLATK